MGFFTSRAAETHEAADEARETWRSARKAAGNRDTAETDRLYDKFKRAEETSVQASQDASRYETKHKWML